MLTLHDLQILRPLVQQYAEIAFLPAQATKRKLWRDHNSLRSARPMVLVDQICWEELNEDGCLDCGCEDPWWRNIETDLRRKLYLWEHMPADMVFNPYLSVPKPLHNTGWGLSAELDSIQQGDDSAVYSQKYHTVLENEEDIEKIRMPEVTMDEKRYEEIRQETARVCEGILPFHLAGETMHLGLWDKISEWRGVESCYLDLYDRPEFLRAIMEKLTRGILHQIDCVNKIGAFDVTSNLTHCSHTFSDDLPKKDCDPEFGRTEDGWAFGLAQLFTAVSPEVTEEFEVPYMNRIFPRFGAIYYGCCERLDDRLDVIAKLKNVRKISCSPWSDRDHFAEAMPGNCVMSAKPTPALLAGDSFDEEAVRKDLRATMDAAGRNGRNLELILKDLSTVRRDPPRLWRWTEIAMEEAQR